MLEHLARLLGKTEAEIEAYKERKGLNRQSSPNESEYWAKVYATETKAAQEAATVSVHKARAAYKAIKAKYEAAEMNWKAAEPMILRIMAASTGIKELCQKTGIDPKKGIGIIGSFGVGKTTAFNTCKKEGAMVSRFASCLDIEKAASKGGYAAIETYERGVVYFDDLGLEKQAMHMGNRFDPVEDILHARARLWEQEEKKTHFSTNLNLDDLIARYDGRIIDRLKGMCNIISLSNTKSFRH